MLAQYVLWRCVCLYVCPSQAGIVLKMAKYRILQTMLHYSPDMLVFRCQMSWKI